MTDPRAAARRTLARALRVRANVRAIAAKVAAGEAALLRDARRNDDPEMATLVSQLAAQRRAIDALAEDLDGRIACLKGTCAAIETRFIDSLIVAAQSTRR